MSSLFLFGAGASCHAGDCDPCAPPDGRGLFDSLRAEGGLAATVSHDLAVLFRKDFELGMAEFERQRNADLQQFQHELGQYFLRFDPGPGNCYVTLLGGLVERGVEPVLSTLNYDLLIESALSRLNLPVAYDPQQQKGVVVLKLHGSCNFLPDLGGITIGQVTGVDCRRHIVGPVRPASRPFAQRFLSTNGVAPAIALYAKGKTVLNCDQFVERVQEMWRERVEVAGSIFVIGVALNREDPHIWEPLRRARAPLWYVGPEPDEVLEWGRNERGGRTEHLERGFAEAIPGILEMHTSATT